ncbi:MAG TPA: TIGR04283 family arsenosugar biosynthesis glycosyltransferase [Stellaceae bacterium]|jgi:rSAM/selenodomain-associated transferase 2|nr:TIGR04283 family arsenosugar biosynthesis glycosyltransferase [Stellaceae bacterium]
MRTFQEHILSVVIPTWNAAAELGTAIAAVAGSPLVGEIIVADGGSEDATVAVAQAAGAHVVQAARGRGPQLAAGAAAATGEWLLFLHADCRPAPGWAGAVALFLAASGAAERAGYFAFGLDDARPAARRLERLVAWRCHLFGLVYGDQGLLISRNLYEALGGFAAIPLMEDVDLVRRIGRRRLRPIGVKAISSARRYREQGFVRRPLRNLFCLSLYFAGVTPRRIARLYG